GPYEFQVTLPNTPEVTKYLLTIYATPDGSWDKQTNSQVIEIVKADQIVNYDPQIGDSSFIIEAFIKIEKGASGVIAEKMAEAGYSLSVEKNGRLSLLLKSGSETKTVTSAKSLDDGSWHHVLAESDRSAKTLTLFIDGIKDSSSEGFAQGYSLSGASDLFVGGTPSGRNLAAAFDFLRISRGSLADAKTSINELYKWEFDGPQFRDFTGRKPSGKRDAGALQADSR
ncbi:MAG: LamG domain-containing protein, partial [Rectinemataceae bacterium]|nr:LamG domain-containing protein [Rectinemataceae bacterium]